MKQIFTMLMLAIFSLGCSQKKPAADKKVFSNAALSQTLENTDGEIITVKDILAKHKGKILVIDFWAGWCKDCLKALPKAKELKAENPDVDFVFLSLDRSKESFAKNMERFEMTGNENYWFSAGWKNEFNNYVELNWIPRYMVIDQKSQIALYYATSPEDPEIQKTIDLLKTK